MKSFPILLAIAAIAALAAFGTPGRAQTVANQFYVEQTGNDSNDCRSHSTPCLTGNGALAQLFTYSSGGQAQFLIYGPGIWQETLDLAGPLVGAGSTDSLGAPLVIEGAGPTATLLTGATSGFGAVATIIANGMIKVQIRGIWIQGTAMPGQTCLFAQYGGQINVIDESSLGPCTDAIAHVENGGSQVLLSGPKVHIFGGGPVGGGRFLLDALYGGDAGVSGGTELYFETSYTFSAAVIGAGPLGHIGLNGMLWGAAPGAGSSPAVGQRFAIGPLGLIDGTDGNPGFIWGTIPGCGGTYLPCVGPAAGDSAGVYR